MNFEQLEQLSDKEIYDLYENNIINTTGDKPACYCECNGTGIRDYKVNTGCGNHQSVWANCISECQAGCRAWSVNRGLTGNCNCTCYSSRYGYVDPSCSCT